MYYKTSLLTIKQQYQARFIIFSAKKQSVCAERAKMTFLSLQVDRQPTNSGSSLIKDAGIEYKIN